MRRTGYDLRTIHHWTVGFEKAEWGGLDTLLTQVLETKLQEIETVLPARPLADLRSAVPIVADLVTRDFPAVAVYHWVGAEPWLRAHEEPTGKAGTINILQAQEFIGLVEHALRYPAALLHEVAHAYHDRFAPDGVNNTVIAEAYRSAVASGIYQQVLNVTGIMHQANAIENSMEYFANTTTAYFLRNDDWPSTRTELAQVDPRGLAMVREVWGV
jgi:hypothetical protein